MPLALLPLSLLPLSLVPLAPVPAPILSRGAVHVQTRTLERLQTRAPDADQAHALVFPTTMTLAKGLMDQVISPKSDVGQVFAGGTEDIELGSLLDQVPADIGGDAGVAKDEAGLARMKEREEAEAKTNEDRAAEFEAKSAEGLTLPSLPKLALPF